MTSRVLIVDDDLLFTRSVAFSLKQAGFNTVTAASAEEALDLLHPQPPNIILLDIGLPGMSGLEALRIFRQRVDVPIIFVTAHRHEIDEIVGLDAGADDYIAKPFDLDVLIAHIKAVLRRAAHTPQLDVLAEQPLHVGNLSIDPPAHVVKVGEHDVELSPKEFDLLLALAQDANRVLSMDTLLSRVWGENWIGETQTLYVHIRWLREKLEIDPNHPHRLLTVKGVGYKLVPVSE
ncbi:MAG TPA: response regulator transcription factor [Phototrophicaceae bacterium]|nr:response regulator transcription factor [Phototrophicaceae bacterium]